MIVELPEIPKKQPQIAPPPGCRIMSTGEVTLATDMQYAHGAWFPARPGYKITRQSAVLYARKNG